MKKIICFIVLCGMAVSCGPRRLGCGPGRCEVMNAQMNSKRDC